MTGFPSYTVEKVHNQSGQTIKDVIHKVLDTGTFQELPKNTKRGRKAEFKIQTIAFTHLKLSSATLARG